jgi:GDP-4-dehydro-6-deoxy-D-mannose reductase
LAGYASAGRSFFEPERAWEGNLTATRSLYEAVRRWEGNPQILYVGSGLIYGEAGFKDEPATEEHLLAPASPYAASKAAADLLSYQVTRSSGLRVVRARPFNHTGPRQPTEYAIPHFAKQIADIEKGNRAPMLETGNLDAVRDLSDVRDVVQAYLLLLERGRPGEAYNICSGEARPMKSALNYLLTLTKVDIEVRQKVDERRSAEPTVVRGNSEKLRRETGWTPRCSFERTLADTLEYWRRQQ